MKISATKDMPALRAAANARIVKAAAAERAKHTTPGKANIYAAKREEAERWLLGRPPNAKGKVPAPDPADYPYLAAETGLTAPTADDLARLWRDLSEQWNKTTAPAIEQRERRAKLAIEAAACPADIDAVKL
jgi:hypothetical protein